MQRRFTWLVLIVSWWIPSIQSVSAQDLPLTAPYRVEGVSYLDAVPTPDDVIGHTIGSTHSRPHQIAEYFRAVGEASDRVTVAEYGRSYENRPLVYAVVASQANHRRLESLREANLLLSDRPDAVSDDQIGDMPVIVNMHFSVHGNEASGSEAAILLLYYLAAGRGEAVEAVLDSAIVVIDPLINPDGRDRFVDWVNGNRGSTPTDDPNDREHREPWPGGRTNHYWFDLNRDWLPLQHPESRARLRLFHDWRPQVLLDVHEMGSDRTFFFQPGVPSRGNPNTPERTFRLTGELTRNSARALDELGSLYYTRETYDDFYYGKGSTYPDINGSVGILFEQGSSRALLRRTDDGILEFGFTVRNQLVAAIGLLDGIVDMRTKLLKNQRDFYAEALDEASSAGFDGWLFGSSNDRTRTQELVRVLRQHRAEIYGIKGEVTIDAKTFSSDDSFFIPVRQPQYRLIKASLEEITTFRDSVFYDVSTWTLPLAFGVQMAEYSGDPESITADRVDAVRLDGGRVDGGAANLAYVMPWGRYYGARALYELLDERVTARVALEPFEAVVDGSPVYFERGSVIVPLKSRGVEEAPRPELIHQMVRQLAVRDHVEFYAVDRGLTPAGIDLGSPRTVPLHRPSVAILSGSPLSAYRVGEAWHLLSERMRIPVSLLDLDSIDDTDLDAYDVLIFVDGSVDELELELVDQVKAWTEQGGRLIAMERAAEWVVGNDIVTAEFPEEEEASEVPWIRYGDRETVEQAREISGAIFEVDLDPSHPIAFGLENRIAIFKSRYSVLKPPTDPGTTVAVYRVDPLISGYAPADRLDDIAATAAIASLKVGEGRVVLVQDVLTFRAFWFGTDMLLLNMILFAEAY